MLYIMYIRLNTRESVLARTKSSCPHQCTSSYGKIADDKVFVQFIWIKNDKTVVPFDRLFFEYTDTNTNTRIQSRLENSGQTNHSNLEMENFHGKSKLRKINNNNNNNKKTVKVNKSVDFGKRKGQQAKVVTAHEIDITFSSVGSFVWCTISCEFGHFNRFYFENKLNMKMNSTVFCRVQTSNDLITTCFKKNEKKNEIEKANNKMSHQRFGRT